MYRAIIWKEFREQGLLGLTLIVLGTGLLATVNILADPPVEGASPNDVIRYLGLGRLATLALAVTAGMVCGAVMFAAERESGTLEFLESLPVSFRQIWRAKVVAGLSLASVYVGLIMALAAAIGLVSTLGWATALLVYSLLAFVWGMLGSTMARTSLGSVGLAIPAAAVTAFAAFIPVALFFQTPGQLIPRRTGAVIFLTCMFLVPVALSFWLYKRPDRSREKSQARQTRSGLNAVVWLTLRQLLIPFAATTPMALVLGMCLLAPGVQAFIIWPGLALGAGVLAGALAFADEQVHGSARFWAEQRLPLTRVWLVKMFIHLLFGVWLLLLLAIPMLIHAQVARLNTLTVNYGYSTLASLFGTALFDEFGRQGWKYLLVPAVYGFAAGHLCSLIFRKLVVTCGVAAVAGGTGSALWGPSLLAGGVRHWQLWIPPALGLLTAFLLLRAWAADRLSARRPLATLVGGTLALLLVMAAGVGYRVLEIPDLPGGEDDLRYMAQLPPLGDSSAGREFKAAAERYSQTFAHVNANFERASSSPVRFKFAEHAMTSLRVSRLPEPVISKLLPLKDHEYSRAELQKEIERLLDAEELDRYRELILSFVPNGNRRQRPEERLEQVPHLGWPADDPQLEAWLDRLFSPKNPFNDDPPWHAQALAAAELPLGIYEHPQLIGTAGVAKTSLEFARQMTVAMLARGLQLQGRGNSAAFIPWFRAVMIMAQSMRNGSAIACLEMGYNIERSALLAVDRWMERLPPEVLWLRAACAPLSAPVAVGTARLYEAAAASAQTELSRKIIALLESCDTSEPFDASRQFLVERHIIREAMKAPGQWLPQVLGLPLESTGLSDPIVDLVGLAWAVPWEKERTRRLVGLGFETGPPSDSSVVRGRPGVSLLLRNRTPTDFTEIDRQLRTHRRAGMLKVALQAFRLDRGDYPAGLNELHTQGYLHRAPADPYSENRSFGYRISTGETLQSPPRTVQSERSVPLLREEHVEQYVHSGQAIIWSVGPDREDQGGKNPPGPIVNVAGRQEDIVYVVPLGPNR